MFESAMIDDYLNGDLKSPKEVRFTSKSNSISRQNLHDHSITFDKKKSLESSMNMLSADKLN